MSRQDILFYIVVPVYKAELFLENCVNSVLGQTYTNWHLILVDDGSPDKSGEICECFAQKDSRIHVIHQVNQGQIAARTTGNKYILDYKEDNSYVVYLDSDDTLELCALTKIAENIKISSAEIIVYDWQRVDNGRIVRDKNTRRFTGLIKDKRELYKIVFSSPFYNSLCVKSISTNLIKEEHYEEYYHIRHAEDLIQSVNYFKNCNCVLFINEVLYNYTINTNSVTQSICYKNYRVDTTVRRLVWDFLKKEKVWTDDDFKLYALSQLSLIKSQIGIISKLDTTFRNKIELLEMLRNDVYFNLILSYPTSDIIIKLLKNGSYRVLLLVCNMYSFLLKFKKQ